MLVSNYTTFRFHPFAPDTHFAVCREKTLGRTEDSFKPVRVMRHDARRTPSHQPGFLVNWGWKDRGTAAYLGLYRMDYSCSRKDFHEHPNTSTLLFVLAVLITSTLDSSPARLVIVRSSFLKNRNMETSGAFVFKRDISKAGCK